MTALRGPGARESTADPPEPFDVLDELIEVNGGQLRLRAAHAHWHTVAEAREAVRGPMRFTTESLVGFLTFNTPSLVAVVGVCSRCGCLLTLHDDPLSLRCPAVGTLYQMNGRVLAPAGHYRPAPLTRVPARLRGGQLQVLIPGVRPWRSTPWAA